MVSLFVGGIYGALIKMKEISSFVLFWTLPISFEIWMRYMVSDLISVDRTKKQQKVFFKCEPKWHKILYIFKIDEFIFKKKYLTIQFLRIINIIFLTTIILVLSRTILPYKALFIILLSFYGISFIVAMLYKRMKAK